MINESTVMENTQIKKEDCDQDLHNINYASNLPLTEESSNYKQESKISDDPLLLHVHKSSCDDEKNSSVCIEEKGNLNITVHSWNAIPDCQQQLTLCPPTQIIATAAGGCGSMSQSPSLSRGRKKLKARRSQPVRQSSLSKRDDTIAELLTDSGSDEESDGVASDEDDLTSDIYLREECKRLRQEIIDREERIALEGGRLGIDVKDDRDFLDGRVSENNESAPSVHSNTAVNVSTEFEWTDDFSTFTGEKENYRRHPGPTFNSSDPVEIFLKVWDDEIMQLIATETNIYARQYIEPYTDPDINVTLPKYLEQWDDVTVPKLYQYFAVLICMSSCQRSYLQEYWETGFMEMPNFRQIMSRDTFLLITKFLHFVGDMDTTVRGPNRKIAKIAPVLDHCNRKFSELYVPAQHICLDESLLLWKGNLSWRQCIRSKTARFGIKSIELCEASTGYLLKSKLYTGKDTSMHPEPFHAFSNEAAKVALELMEGYMDVGHVLVIDNWYNQLLLTRYLKSRDTDVLGAINRTRKDIPQDLKDLAPNRFSRGEFYARHCRDIALVAFKGVKLVTLMSTYHQQKVKSVAKDKPISVKDYNRYMGGVDLKDRQLSMFLFERNRCHKWYIKVFRRLLNTSLLNAFIIYTKQPRHRLISHRTFRRNVAEGLIARFGNVISPMPASVSNTAIRLQPGKHFPVHTEMLSNKTHKKMYCVRCRMLRKRVQVRLMCSLCEVPLCVGLCWLEYHTRQNLSKTCI